MVFSVPWRWNVHMNPQDWVKPVMSLPPVAMVFFASRVYLSAAMHLESQVKAAQL
jgi:hypothetical protein